MDTIFAQSNEEVIDLIASISGSGIFEWTTDGDGTFNDSSSPLTQYILGDNDKQYSLITLFLSGKSECEATGKELIIIRNPCAFAYISSGNDVISCYHESTMY